MQLIKNICIVLLLMCIAQTRLELVEKKIALEEESGLTSGDDNDDNNDEEESNATRKTTGDNASADSDDVNPDDEYEDAQVVDDLFNEEKNCRMMFALGVRLINLNKNQCLEQCLETDSCNSVSFNPSVDITDESSSDDEEEADAEVEREMTPVCRLNTETKGEVGPFFQCGGEAAQGWDHYEKLPDYFLIFNKENGRILKAVDENSVTLASKSDDDCFWFWSGENIYSKKYPDRLLSVQLRTHVRILNTMVSIHEVPYRTRQKIKYMAGLKKKGEGLEQKWSFGDDGLLKPSFKDADLLLALRGPDEVVLGLQGDVYSQFWTLSLERSYFILTNRDSGNVVQAHKTDGSVIMSKYNGDDDQLWFWDDTTIRSRKFPDKVLEVTRGEGGFEYGDANLVTYRKSRSNLLQKWEADYDNIRTLRQRRRRSTRTTLCAKTKGTEKGVRVVGCSPDGERSDRWSFSSARMYFFILEKQTGKVIQVDSTNSVSFQHYDASKKQLFFWDQDVIRSKLYTDKVLSVDGHNRVRLSSFHGSNDLETWSYDGTCLISKAGDQKLKYQGSQIVLSRTSDQHWSIAVSHDFFTIWNKASGQVLDISQESADRGEKVITWKYHGEDHQRWFWDNRNIRSKKYPGKVLEMKVTAGGESSSWLDVHMADFTGETNQQWRHEGKYFVCDRQGRHLSVKEFNPVHLNKKEVGACKDCSDAQKEYFSYSSQAPVYFGLIEKQIDKVFSFDVNVRNKLKTETLERGDDKYWFWEGDSIRSKVNSRYVLTLKKDEDEGSEWWTLTADTFHDPPVPTKYQTFRYDKENYIVVPKDGFQIEQRQGSYGGYSIVGRQTGNKRIQMAMVEEPPEPEPEEESCIDETEQKIYSVVEWIPFVSTLWDLFSSIGYGIAGCDSVAQERAISMSIGLVTDIATAATFGAATAPLTALKTGAKVGIKLGIKAGLKATVTVAKTSIKTAFKKTITMGLKQGLKKGLTRAGKFIAKETIIDPAMFLKNIGKVSKQVLTRPKKTFVQLWKAGKEGVENLKNLRKKLVDSGENVCKLSGRSHVQKNITHDAKKRGCFEILLKKDLKDAKKHLRDLVDSPNYAKEAMDAAEERYGTLVRDTDRYKLWESQAEKPANWADLSQAEKLRVFAVFEYTRVPDINQYTRGFFYDGKSEKKWLKKRSKDEIDEIVSQASLINDFLKKNAVDHPPTGTIVHRFEPLRYKDIYQVGKKYSDMRVVSTTVEDSVERVFGNAVKLAERPRHLIMNLKKSGCDVHKFAQVSSQKEITLPMGTRFEVMSREVKNIDGVEVVEIKLNEID